MYTRVEKSKRLLLANWMWSTSQENCHELSSCSIFNKSMYDFAWSKKTHEGENVQYATIINSNLLLLPNY
jgi:hypothetical protein